MKLALSGTTLLCAALKCLPQYRVASQPALRSEEGNHESKDELAASSPRLTFRTSTPSYEVFEVSQLTSRPNGSWCPAWIPRRRQKQLLQLYPAHLLPPSPINPVEPVPVQWPSGTVINWVGEYKPKEYKSIYANRRQLFKGHKRERERAERKAEVDGRLETMDARIAEWKAVSIPSVGLLLRPWMVPSAPLPGLLCP